MKKWFDGEKSLTKQDLKIAAKDIMAGVYEANLGGHVYKKRVSNSMSKGKSGGSRLIVAYKKGHTLFFMYAFNKNDTANPVFVKRVVAFFDLKKMLVALINHQGQVITKLITIHRNVKWLGLRNAEVSY